MTPIALGFYEEWLWERRVWGKALGGWEEKWEMDLSDYEGAAYLDYGYGY